MRSPEAQTTGETSVIEMGTTAIGIERVDITITAVVIVTILAKSKSLSAIMELYHSLPLLHLHLLHPTEMMGELISFVRSVVFQFIIDSIYLLMTMAVLELLLLFLRIISQT
jgi:hypothetical protein